MKKMMPQEIEVWYLIPAIRKELSLNLIKKHGLSQKETAKILGVTEAAISQYLNSKRAIQTRFSKKDKGKIENSAGKIVNNPKDFMKILYNLSNDLKETKVICEIHKNHDKSVDKNCNICFQR